MSHPYYFGIRFLCRSGADPDQYTQIPFKAKALKILLKELEQSRNALETGNDDSDEDEDEGQEEDTDWEDDNEDLKKGAVDLSGTISI